MPIGRLNNVATADDFPGAVTGATLGLTVGDHPKSFNVIVTGAAIYMDPGVGGAGAGIVWEERPIFVPPGGYGFTVGPGKAIERADAVRFRSAVAGVSARVTAFGS